MNVNEIEGYNKLSKSRQGLLEIVLNNFDKGIIWTQGWTGSGSPESATSGKKYRGTNNLYLALVSMAEGYSDNRWATYKQMEERGWSFKKDEELDKEWEQAERELQEVIRNICPYLTGRDVKALQSASYENKSTVLCLNCGDMYETDKNNALGHIYTETTRDATCTLDGGHVHTCTVCGYEYITEVEKAIGHTYNTEVARVASCELSGERHFHCEKCADEYYTEIPCTGHNFELYETEVVDGKTTRTYICTNCGLIQEQDMGEQYEKVSSYVEHLFDEYSPYMVWVFIATSGVWSIVMGVFFAIAQKNEEKEKARKMVKNYIIGIVVIFCIVVACPYLVKGIAALIT